MKSNQLVLGTSLLALPSVAAFTGDGTTYSGKPSSGNCNLMYWPSVAETNYVAINDAQWDNTMSCGRCAQVRCTDAACSGQPSELVYVVDRCPECKHGDLDLSPQVYSSITGQQPGRVGIEWEFVDCPVEGNVEYCLKSGSSKFWLALQPANFVSGVQSMTIDGKTPEMLGAAYYFLLNQGVDGSLDALDITLTGVNGEVLEETLALKPDTCTEGTKQFSRSDTSVTFTAATTTTTLTELPTTATPAPAPTEAPTQAPTEAPTTAVPTQTPTEAPTQAPTEAPTQAPTEAPTTADSTQAQTEAPSTPTNAAWTEVTTPALTTQAPTESQTQSQTTAQNQSVDSTQRSAATPCANEKSSDDATKHSSGLMTAMVSLACVGVFIAAGLALYVRHHKKKTDMQKDLGEVVVVEDLSPGVSPAFEPVHSPKAYFARMESLEARV